MGDSFETLESAIKDEGHYTFFKLRSSVLTLTRRGKDIVFRKGEPLGWRVSSAKNHIRLISPINGRNIVYSLPISQEVTSWLAKQDPTSTKVLAQLPSFQSGKQSQSTMGFVITDGKWFYHLGQKPTRSLSIKPKVMYQNRSQAERDAKPFKVERKLSVVPVTPGMMEK
jgi:hypothetical protein